MTKLSTDELDTLHLEVAQELLRRIREGEARSSDLATAVKLVTYHRREAEDPDQPKPEPFNYPVPVM
ncbi:hypothetical protein RGUI_1090 [Rhodovulum sp. P5]|uniref:hypothetical protein n=1 Tax=Rhodovulum sp. P5 TaxID=1564506 RepID=UPI0009C25262|nr:hypothetical protein [Rhodovulum sp. P5]ARE39231.1 hypothetical protein RGUI_1090 [Rhodovulum sp. P5]